MASTFDTKFDAILDKIPHSVMETPWKRTLFWIMYGVVAIAALLLVVIFELVKGLFEENGKSSGNTPPVGDQRTQAEINAEALSDETLFLHNHYEMNGTVVQGLKDPEW